MYAVVRTYSGAGAKKLFDVLEKRSADVEALIRGDLIAPGSDPSA